MSLFRRFLVLCAAGFGVLVLVQAPAAAHTGFESSEPANGSVVGEISEIVVHFSGAADPVDEGFVILDGAGVIRQPDVLVSNDEKSSWTLEFEQPLSSGTVGVRWTVQAPDAHPIKGTFSFTVDAPVAPEPTEVAPAAPKAPEGLENQGSSVDTAGDTAAVVTTPPTTEAAIGTAPVAVVQDLDAFLDTTSAAKGAEAAGAVGRLVGFVGSMLAIGGLVFATYVVRDRRPDILSVLKVVGYSGVIVVAGAAIELVARIAVANDDWASSWSPAAIEAVGQSAFGLGVGLKMAAGLMVFVAARLMARALPLHLAAQPALALTTAGSEDARSAGSPPDGLPMKIDERTDRVRISPIMASAILILLASFTFDGHTVTEGNRWITTTVDMVHVVAASIWAGGVVAFAVVLRRRRRQALPLNALELAIRFSVIAGAALAVAGLAGSLLAVIILDDISELWSTAWGQLLIMKFLVVSTAALIGAHNHFEVIPWLKASPADEARSAKLRLTVVGEAMLLVIVIAITAFLVGATPQ